MPEPTPLGGRAAGAADNSIEAAIFYEPLGFLTHLSGHAAEALLGAQIAFWARVAHVPIYLAGIIYLRSLVWFVGVVGYGLMVNALL